MVILFLNSTHAHTSNHTYVVLFDALRRDGDVAPLGVDATEIDGTVRRAYRVVWDVAAALRLGCAAAAALGVLPVHQVRPAQLEIPRAWWMDDRE